MRHLFVACVAKYPKRSDMEMTLLFLLCFVSIITLACEHTFHLSSDVYFIRDVIVKQVSIVMQFPLKLRVLPTPITNVCHYCPENTQSRFHY